MKVSQVYTSVIGSYAAKDLVKQQSIKTLDLMRELDNRRRGCVRHSARSLIGDCYYGFRVQDNLRSGVRFFR